MTSCALGKLGHPEGEVVLTRTAGKKGIIQMMPTLASCSMDEMMDAAVPGQPLWFQLYVNQDRTVTERIVRHAEKRGVKALFITVDAPQVKHWTISLACCFQYR
jgi:L-lactate dehydrogenase (cytochrome)